MLRIGRGEEGGRDPGGVAVQGAVDMATRELTITGRPLESAVPAAA